MLPATAQDEGPPVPVEKAAYHWPVFRNDYVMLLRVYMAPGKGSNYHVHSLDQISILIEAGANAGQVFGKERMTPKAGDRGAMWVSRPIPRRRSPTARPTSARHRSTISSSPCCKPEPGNFPPQAREVPGYTQLFDNERARAWRLS